MFRWFNLKYIYKCWNQSQLLTQSQIRHCFNFVNIRFPILSYFVNFVPGLDLLQKVGPPMIYCCCTMLHSVQCCVCCTPPAAVAGESQEPVCGGGRGVGQFWYMDKSNLYFSSHLSIGTINWTICLCTIWNIALKTF